MSFRGIVGVSLGDTGEFLLQIDNLAAQKLKSRQSFVIKNRELCVVKSQIPLPKRKKRENQKHLALNMPHTRWQLCKRYSLFPETQCTSQ